MEKHLKRIVTMQRMQKTGLELFYQKGYFNTSIDDILKSLSLSKGAFYYHFASKDEFFIGIIQQLLFRKVYSALIEPLESNENPLTLIERTLDNTLETAQHNKYDYGFALGNFLNEFNGRHPEIMRYLKDITKVWEVNLISALQRGKSNGYVSRHIDSESVALFIISSFLGMRTLMVEGNGKLLRYKYMQQLRTYLKTMEAVTH
ncbi:TetR/AcrR family transcriptional regulator [Sediminicola luteus]|uniref:TetR family transcriptional regulator n=1 Tax=Sediminicola luteus TaxID=319238 RepID=A0A2A4GD71_9FLAO|nr:TetR/AcrR family transcriptional regulator [Sediminicola luteus]PCE66371.1 TetR family transcriptional regulator [Sediminicola luteus]